jgi:Protein of unknown function (DUF3712)
MPDHYVRLDNDDGKYDNYSHADEFGRPSSSPSSRQSMSTSFDEDYHGEQNKSSSCWSLPAPCCCRRCAISVPVHKDQCCAHNACGRSCCGSRKRCTLSTLVWIVLLLGASFVLVKFWLGPYLAENALSRASLEFQSVTLEDPHGISSFKMGAKASIHNPSFLSAKIAPIVLTAWFQGNAIGTVTAPPLDVGAGETVPLDLDSEFVISDIDAFDEFSRAALHADQVEFSMTGAASVTSLGFTFDGVAFDKTLQLGGCNGLPNVTLEVFDLSSSSRDSIDIDMMVRVVNPSRFNLPNVGATKFGIYYEDAYMGHLESQHTALVVGTNQLHMIGKLQPHNVSVAGHLMSRYLTGVSSTVTAKAANSSASSLPLFSAALQGLELNTELLGNFTKLISDMEFRDMNLLPLADEQHAVQLSTAIEALIENPLGANSPINISSVDVDATLHLVDAEGKPGKVFGTMQVSSVPASEPQGPAYVDAIQRAEHSGAGGAGGPSFFFVKLDVDEAQLKFADGNNAEAPMFTTFATQVLKQAEVRIFVMGTISAHASIAIGDVVLKDLALHNVVTLGGFDGLQSISINKFHLPSDNANGPGVTAEATISINNPSKITLAAGDVAFDVVAQVPGQSATWTRVGSLSAHDMQLNPGANQYDLTGYVKPDDDSLASKVFSKYLVDESVPVRAEATSTYGHSTWLLNTLKGVQLNMQLPGLDYEQPIHGTTMDSAGIDAVMVNDKPTLLLSSTTAMQFAAPFPFPLTVVGAQVLFSVQYKSSTTTAQVHLPYLPITDGQSQSKARHPIGLQFSKQTVDIVDESSMSTMLRDMLLLDSVTFQYTAVGTVTVKSALGTLEIEGLPLADSITLPCMNRFMHPEVQVTKTDVVSGDGTNALSVSLGLKITVPSPAYMNVGHVQFYVKFNNEIILNATVNEFGVDPPSTIVVSPGVLFRDPHSASQRAAFKGYLEAFSNGHDSTVTLYSAAESSPFPILHEALGAFSTTFVSPGVSTPFIVDATMHITFLQYVELFLGTRKTIDITIDAQNPFSGEISITNIQATITSTEHSMQLGVIAADISSKPIVIPGKTQVGYTGLQVRIKSVWSKAIRDTLWNELKAGSSHCNFVGSLTLKVGNFAETISYTQNSIPLYLGKKK